MKICPHCKTNKCTKYTVCSQCLDDKINGKYGTCDMCELVELNEEQSDENGCCGDDCGMALCDKCVNNLFKCQLCDFGYCKDCTDFINGQKCVCKVCIELHNDEDVLSKVQQLRMYR